MGIRFQVLGIRRRRAHPERAGLQPAARRARRLCRLRRSRLLARRGRATQRRQRQPVPRHRATDQRVAERRCGARRLHRRQRRGGHPGGATRQQRAGLLSKNGRKLVRAGLGAGAAMRLLVRHGAAAGRVQALQNAGDPVLHAIACDIGRRAVVRARLEDGRKWGRAGADRQPHPVLRHQYPGIAQTAWPGLGIALVRRFQAGAQLRHSQPSQPSRQRNRVARWRSCAGHARRPRRHRPVRRHERHRHATRRDIRFGWHGVVSTPGGVGRRPNRSGRSMSAPCGPCYGLGLVWPSPSRWCRSCSRRRS